MICPTTVLNALLIAGSALPVNCDIILTKDIIVKRDILIQDSNLSINCNNATLKNVFIKSKIINETTVLPPENITIKNCNINNIRIEGLAINGQGELNLKDSRINPNHTKYMQINAPSKISILNNTFSNAGIKIYLSPGVNRVTIANNTIAGISNSVGVYLDAESSNNTIINNSIAVVTEKREQLAIDGSANNYIAKNTFKEPKNGGIFLYRNCGEGGAIRFQTPSNNVIEDNTFIYKTCHNLSCAKPGIWISSRMRGYINNITDLLGYSFSFCNDDKGYWPNLNTSATNDNDNASNNIIRNNKGLPFSLLLNTEFVYKNSVQY